VFSPKHQNVPFGLGYLPVFIQYFGVTILLVELVLTLLRFIRNTFLKNSLLAVLATLLASVFIVNHSTNRVVVEEENKVLLYPRDIFDRAIRSGFLAEIPEGSTLVASPEFFWNDKYFVFGGSGKRLNVMNLPPYYRSLAGQVTGPQSYRFCELSDQNVYFIKYDSDGLGRGYVALGKVESVVLDPWAGTFAEVRIASLSVFTDNKTEKVVVAKTLDRPRDRGTPCIWEIPAATDEELSDGLFSARDLLRGVKCDFLSLRIKDRNDPETQGLAASRQTTWAPSTSRRVFVADENRVSSVELGTETFLMDFLTTEIVGIQRDNQASRNRHIAADQSPVYTYRPVAKLTPSFSIEILVKAGPTQTPYANLLSNHPGLTNFEGFTIEQDGSRDNYFQFAMADGQKWVPQFGFSLPLGAWTYLAINVKDKLATLYINGEMVDSSTATTGFVESAMPITIGDWTNGDRTFSGLIREVAIGRGELDKTGVRRTWESIEVGLTDEVSAASR